MASIPGLWAFVVSAGLMISLWIFSTQYIKQPIGRAFFLLVSSALFWLLMYIGELVVESFSVKLIFVRLQFIGINTLPVAWLILSVLHTKEKLKKWVWYLIAAVWVTLFIFIFIIPTPNYFWGNPKVVLLAESTLLYVIDYNYGPLFYILLTPFTYVLLSISFVFMVKGLSRGHVFYRKQLNLVITGTVIPAVINLFYIIGITPIPHVNFSSAGMIISEILVGYALFRYRFLAVSPIARDLIIDTMLDSVIVIDTNLNVLDVNSAGKELLDSHGVEIGKKLYEIVPTEIMDSLYSIMKAGNKEPMLLTFINRVYDVHINPLVEFGGEHNGYLIMFHDVSEREMLHRQVKVSATLDPLTQILNRKTLFELIEKHREKIYGTERSLSLIMMDIDHFKEVNDTYGHEGGDRAIEKLVDEVQKTLGKKDLFGRYGGDEFVVALVDASFERTLEVARIIHSRVTSSLISCRKATFMIQLSLGVVTFGGEGNFPVSSTSDELVAFADSALYKAKDEGKNTIAFVHPSHGKKIDPQLEFEGLS